MSTYSPLPGRPVADFALTRTIPKGRGCRKRLRSTPFLRSHTRWTLDFFQIPSDMVTYGDYMWLLSFVVNVVKFLGGCRRMRISTCSNRVLLASNWHRDHIRHNQGLKTNTLRQSFNGSLHCRWKTRPLQWHDQWHPSPLAPTLCCQPVGQSVCTPWLTTREPRWTKPCGMGHEAMRPWGLLIGTIWGFIHGQFRGIQEAHHQTSNP